MTTAPPTRLLVAAAAALALGQPGCAWTFGERAKTADPSVVPACSASRAPAIADGMLAAAFGLTAVAVSRESTEVGIPIGLLAAVHLASAVGGGVSASRCTDLRKAHTAWIEQERLRWTQTAAQPADVADPAAPGGDAPEVLDPVAPGGGVPDVADAEADAAGAALREPTRGPAPAQTRPQAPPRPPPPPTVAQPPAATPPARQPDEPADEPGDDGPWDDFWTEDQR